MWSHREEGPGHCSISIKLLGIHKQCNVKGVQVHASLKERVEIGTSVSTLKKLSQLTEPVSNTPLL